MTYQGAEFSVEELFREVKKRAQYEKVQNFSEYKTLVDDLIEEKKVYGFLLDDEDTIQTRETLEARWSEIKEDIGHISGILR